MVIERLIPAPRLQRAAKRTRSSAERRVIAELSDPCPPVCRPVHVGTRKPLESNKGLDRPNQPVENQELGFRTTKLGNLARVLKPVNGWGVDMPKKRPRIARLDQVRISRDGEDAIIEFRDPTIATTQLKIGPQVHGMTDEEVLLAFNQTVVAGMRHRDELGDYVAIEIPVGNPQLDSHPETANRWSPRGGALRCLIEDAGGEDGSLPVITVDDREFTWDEFGRMLCTYAGWGMRIVFVPDDELHQIPRIVVREPDK